MQVRIETLAEKRYTLAYSQPEAYHFCQDSVLAPLVIANDLRDVAPFHDLRCLDMGAGCGVMGLELAFAMPNLRHFDFLEIQPEFREHFERNLKLTDHSATDFRFREGSWENLTDQYDLVVSNPPYFMKDEGTLGANPLSNRCRFFLDSTFEVYARSIVRALNPDGRGYLLLKNGRSHGRDPFTLLRTIAWDCEVNIIADIRGTDLVRIIKPKTPGSKSQGPRQQIPY